MSLPQLLSTRPTGVVLSPSQLDVFDLCKRKWAFQYILGIRSPSTPSAQLGAEVHKHLEAWLKFATPPPQDTLAGRIARKMISNLPPPGTGAVERKSYLRTALGHFYTLVIDWTGIFNMRPTVIDHKTTGNWEYAKTPEDLLTDSQGIIYSLAGFVGFQTDEVDLLWNYGSTKPKRIETKPVRATVRLPLMLERFNGVVEDTASEILSHYARNTQPHELPANANACSAYGGCPHRGVRCNVTDEERVQGIFMSGMTMAERMRQQAAGAGGNGAVAVAQDPQAQPQPTQAQAPFANPVPVSPFFGAQQPATQPNLADPAFTGQPWPPAEAAPPFNPEGGPNPPESGQALPQAPAAAPQAATEGPKGPGRPPGARNKRVKAEGLTAEQHAFMIGVGAALTVGPQPLAILMDAGNHALRVFKEKFGG